MDDLDLDQDKEMWHAFMNTVINFGLHKMQGNFLTSCETIKK